MAVSSVLSGYALTKGEYVYTPQGRFLITGDNLNANNTFQDFSGWTVISPSGKTVDALFNTNANGYADGFNSLQSLDASTAGEGLYYKFEPSSATVSYVVSFKMKGAVLDNIKVRIPGDGYKKEECLVKIAGNTAGTYTYPSTEDEVVVNTAEELNENWQTFNYAIVGNGEARTWFISLTQMATTIEIADLQIAQAQQYADLRQRDALLSKLNTYKNCYDWKGGEIEESGLSEAIEGLEAIGEESTQEDLDEAVVAAQDILAEFLNAYMDDYLAGGSTASGANDNYLGIKTTSGNTQKAKNLGDWQPKGVSERMFWSSGAYPDLGHYAGNTGWNFGNTSDPMGVYMQKTLDPGSYVFGIESTAALREDATSSSWTNNDGWNPAYGIAYIVKVVDGVTTDTIVRQIQDLDAVVFTPFLITAKIEEAGTYEIGYAAYCKDAYKDLKNGSVTYVANASIYGKNDNKYNQKQLNYEADVREQITAGRDGLTKAAEYLASAEYVWGKAALKDSVDKYTPVIESYEALDQDAIIATYDADEYVKSTSAETGLMVYEVYQAATRWILAANKLFLAVNDTLQSIQPAIEGAEETLKLRVYDASTGKAELQAAIQTAKGVQTAMKATDYSEENAATIVAAIATLNDAVVAFKEAVPASAFTSIIDIDFEAPAVQNPETSLYSVSGPKGTMEFSTWSVDGSGNQPFEQGYWSNAEQLYKGYIRVGNGTGTVTIDPAELGELGTNILRFSFDFFLQGLSGRNVGFFIKGDKQNEETQATEQVTIASFYANYYNVTIDATSTLPISLDNLKFGSGGSYNNAAPEGAVESGTVCAKNSFEVILDFGEGSMYAVTTSGKGTFMTEKQAFDRTVPTAFVLQSNYNNNDRRVWFDNLKIERVAAGPTEDWVETGINAVAVKKADNAVYSLTGVKMNGNLKSGLYIVNGKKFVIK